MAAEVDLEVVTRGKGGCDADPHSSRNEGQSRERYSNTKNFIAGGLGGVAAVASGHPFDTIKVNWVLRHPSIHRDVAG